jgi:hypothetical protein
LRVTHLIAPVVAALALTGAAAPAASAQSAPPATTGSGGVGIAAPPAPPSTPAHPTVPGWVAKIRKGVAYAPTMAPIQVKRAIWAGDKIRKKPYIWGGGHAAFTAAGYDCSGSVSYVLHAAGLLKTPLVASDFMSWGVRGAGMWITVYANSGHAFIEIAGIRFDTSSEADPHPPPGTGPRWRPLYPHPPGFMARHPAGL